jgi:aryl-alcohol dehydrogenase-like predicted oxidoreductase
MINAILPFLTISMIDDRTCMGISNRGTLAGLDDVLDRREQENQSVRTIELFLKLGLNFFDTAWTCEQSRPTECSAVRSLTCDTTSEMVLGYAISQFGRKKFVVSTKFHVQNVQSFQNNLAPTVSSISTLSANQSPLSDGNSIEKIIRSQLAASLRRLGTDFIDLYYQQESTDDHIVIDEVMLCLKTLVRERKIRYIGLSASCGETIRRAHGIHPITAVFTEYSFQNRVIEHEALKVCRELGIGIIARYPYGSSTISPDYPVRRGSDPRGSPEKKIKKSTSNFLDLATEKNCTPNQLALGWLHAQGIDIFPLIESNSAETVFEAFLALKSHLYGTDVEEIGTFRLSDSKLTE